MSPTIYSDFLSNIEKKHRVVKIPFLSFTNNMYKYLLHQFKQEYNTITYLAHSSGATTAINNINSDIDKLILLDPVATPTINYQIDLKNLKSFTIINAELSFKWSYIPPFIPFIPIFTLNTSNLLIDKQMITCIDIKDYGHSDIIDNPYRDIMHFSRLSVGNRDRKNNINDYHIRLSNIIDNIINND
tara:strand:- start:144 stop:704 length:561 start_codon:yes stop_codon:yes gene_type:complete